MYQVRHLQHGRYVSILGTPADAAIKSYIQSFFGDLESLLAHTKLTKEARVMLQLGKLTPEHEASWVLLCILNCSVLALGERAYELFTIDFEPFYDYFGLHFMGYEEHEIKHAIFHIVYEHINDMPDEKASELLRTLG